MKNFHLFVEKIPFPSNITDYEKDWKAIKIDGILDFSLVGVLSNISSLLSNNNIAYLLYQHSIQIIY